MVSRFHFPGQPYFYIAGEKPSGGAFFLGPYETEAEARIKAYEQLKGVVFDVFKSKHRDARAAQSEYRPTILEKSGSIDTATQRITHAPNKIM
jgi:hypothetical protein